MLSNYWNIYPFYWTDSEMILYHIEVYQLKVILSISGYLPLTASFFICYMSEIHVHVSPRILNARSAVYSTMF